MKSIFLSMLIMIPFYGMVNAQTDPFFDDIATMKLSLCFKDYIIADGNMDPGELPSGMTSQRVFLNSDSSLMVHILLSNIPSLMSVTNYPNMHIFQKENQNSQRKKDKLLIEKFGARSGFVTGYVEQSSPHFDRYLTVWGAMLFSELGMVSIIMHQKESSRSKMSEKTLVKLASNFILFNN